jgi:hypothetical protein
MMEALGISDGQGFLLVSGIIEKSYSQPIR